MANNNQKKVTGWVGWVFFAGYIMITVGFWQMIAGLTALLNDQYYLLTSNSLAVFDITTWGWIHLVLGLFVILAGMSILNGHLWGRVVAIFMAMISIIANFTELSSYPI